MNSRDGRAWIAKNGMGDGHLYTLYVGKRLIGVYGSAAEAKAKYELPQPAPVETR